VINYRLAPQAIFSDMAYDCAMAVKWMYDNAESYRGDRNRIIVMGHSAGGHLAALITLNEYYFSKLNISNPVKGCVLLDAFGLNIGTLLQEHQTAYNYLLHKVFTDNPLNWSQGSPANFIDSNKIPFMIYAGDRTYPFIMLDNGMFIDRMKKVGHPFNYRVIAGKNHTQMVTQMENRDSDIYKDLLALAENPSRTVKS
jgi:acetyl esterase/lipase